LNQFVGGFRKLLRAGTGVVNRSHEDGSKTKILTLQASAWKCSPPMAGLDPHFYEEWRERAHGRASLREGRGGAPAEKVLQQIWFHQRLLRDELKTLDGRAVRVVHPGFWNQEAGPDFRGAIVQIGGGPAVTGDIEIDLQASGWRGHGHAENPAYANVVLHVLWEAAAATAASAKLDGGARPQLALKEFLDAPLADLEKWLLCEPTPVPSALQGRCRGPLGDLPEPVIEELLTQAALVRLRRKAAQIEARARQRGWEQALWEELLAALGYKHNTWPMRRVAELAPVESFGLGQKLSAANAEARFLGIANLLPGEIAVTKTESDRHARVLWDHWWRQAEGVELVPKNAWRFAGLRPANHPARRVALAAQWASEGGVAQRLERWLLATVADGDLEESLGKVFATEPNEFWSRHWTFKSKPTASEQPLLGSSRATDLSVNVVLPWLWVRANAGRNEALRAEAERRYLAWAPAQDNTVLKRARERLLGGRHQARTAAHQQGLMQIVRDFCDHSNAACESCRFPDLVRAIPQAPEAV
jgi:hypothetical protein